MRRLLLSVAGAVALAVTAVATPATAAHHRHHPRPATPAIQVPTGADHGITRAQIFDSAIPDTSVYAGKNVRYVWGSGQPAQPAGTQGSRYLPIVRDLDWTNRPIAWWQANHPTWVLYKADGTPAFQEGGNAVPLDVDNADVRTWYWDTHVQPAIDRGYTMIALDNVVPWNWIAAKGVYAADGTFVDKYTGVKDDPAYSATVLNWLRYLTDRLHQAGIAVAGNVTPLGDTAYERTQSRAAVGIVDLWLHEGGFTRARDANITDDEWAQTFQLYRDYAATKSIVDVGMATTAHLADANPAQLDWILANYFLVREDGTMLALVGKFEYGMFLDSPLLATDLGTAGAAPVHDASGAWTRSYSAGFTVVNPSSTASATVPLPAGNYVDTHGTAYSGQATLAPDTGLVLTRS
ncbi:putative glycoside hydrolase [Actinocatenispora rupis]|uniref:Uncharacterized protein n=1 Tax=Actinocatenispora rupis TaxID=519421 RepID=A0A8J3NBL6_9ACTN|nr:putative glycoside hydrolase [Actinocatenispora rupis]GID10792.1 hypothetical protein Aru02nite_16810 [Actinocatenispora rupis]